MADPTLRSGSTILDGASEASGCQVGFIVRCSEQGPASPVMVLHVRLDRGTVKLAGIGLLLGWVAGKRTG